MKVVALWTCLVGASALAATTSFVAVGTSATSMPGTPAFLRKGLVIENRGANDLWCHYLAPGVSGVPTITAGRGHLVLAGTARTFPPDMLWCATSVAQTGTGSDVTLVSELN